MTTKLPDSIYSVLLVETAPGVFGGYKRSCIYENLSDRDEHFTICSSCKGLMRDACTIEQLDNLACESCTEGSAHSVFAVGRKSIAEIDLRCPLSIRGCTWIGKSQIAEKHLETCDFFLVTCPLNCSDAVQRCEIENHLRNVCSNRLMPCNYCESIIEVYTEDSHLRECSGYEIECVKGCNSKVKRRELANHLEVSCPLSLVNCVFAEIGCTIAGIARKDLREHEELCHRYHMELLINANHEQKKQIESLRCELEQERESKEELKVKVLTQTNEITELRNRTDSISKELEEVKGGLLTVRARIPEEHGCHFQKELSMTLTDLKRMKEMGDGTIVTEIEIERYELDCYAKTENTNLLFYLRSWDGSCDEQLIWPFSAECQMRIVPAKKGASKLEHKPVRLQLDRVPHRETTIFELSRDLHKVESKSSRLIGLFPLSIVLGEWYYLEDSLKLELTLKCYNFV